MDGDETYGFGAEHMLECLLVALRGDHPAVAVQHRAHMLVAVSRLHEKVEPLKAKP